jgi:hypothetical protein
MSLSAFAWIGDTQLGAWVASSSFIWPALECIHFASLCVLVGSVVTIDLRLIGFFRDRCASLVQSLIRVSLVAFGVNFLTGILFFAGNTPKFVNNSALELKLVLIALAGLNALYFKLRLSHLVDSEEVTWSSIGVGYASLFLWAGVIVCGRMITFYAR